MQVLEQELTETIKVWPVVSKVISTIHTEEQYEKVVRLLDKLIDEVSQKEDPVIESLILAWRNGTSSQQASKITS